MTSKMIIICVLLITIVGCSESDNGEFKAIDLVSSIKEYKITSLDSKTISFNKVEQKLSDNYSKPYLLVFLTTWCEYCLGQAQHIANIERNFGDKINIYGIFADKNDQDKETMEKIVKESNTTFPWFYKGNIEKLTDAYRINEFPFIALFDKQGNMVMSYNGVTPEEMIVFDIKKTM